MGEITRTQHAFGANEGGALWESEASQYDMINIMVVMQMVGRRGEL